MLAIVVYILLYTIFLEKRYLVTERPIGSIRLSLLKGKNPLPQSELEYCWQPNRTTLPSGDPTYPCLYQDELFDVFPTTEATAMLATTRYIYMQQALYCNLQDPTCSYTMINSSLLFVADIEHFTLLIDHTLYAPLVGIQKNAKALPGSMSYYNGTKMHLSGPNNVIGQAGSTDIVEIATLLEAAGIESLDMPSTYNQSSTMRYDGIVLMIFIVYSNTETHDLNYITYTYKPSLITDTEFKSVQANLINSTFREIYNRHGIRMIFVQDGTLGRFDFQVTLLTFVSGLGLLTVSAVIVDLIAVYILPQKKIYEDYKYTREDGRSFACCGGRSYSDVDESTPINQKIV